MLLAALGPLYWGRPFGDLIYGQDSTRLFLPFSFNDSPFIPYSYLFSSTFPVPDFTPYFYIDATLRGLDSLGIAPWVTERVVLGVFAGLAAAGTVLLLRAIDSARSMPVQSRGWAVGLVALVYVYNPFTLSVSFWHVEGWTLFLALLPWVATLVVRVVYDPGLPLRFAAIATLIGIYLAPGAISSFAVPVGIVLGWGLLAVWTRHWTPPVGLRRRLAQSLVLVAVGVGVELWSFVPFLLVPNIAYTANNYVTPQNLIAIYLEASSTWGPYPVLTLTALSWISHTPSAYPWIHLLPEIATAAVVFPLVWVLGGRRLRESPGSLLVYAMGLTALPFMIGVVAPIQQVNEKLLHVGGPFLALVGGFYFLAPLYILAATVGLYETLGRRIRAGPTRPSAPPTGAGTPEPLRKTVRRSMRPSAIAAFVLAALLLVSGLPFLLGEVYQTSGPNADVVVAPSSFASLENFFGTPPTGPDYYVLVLPMSAQNGVYLDLGGRQFLDTGNLIATYIPYPVLETDNGATAASVEQALSMGPFVNLPGLLANLHIRYVVVNPFANQSAPTLNEAPGGASVDYGAIERTLAAELGPGSPVGEFTVFSVPNAIPLGWATSHLVGVQTATDSETLGLVGSVASAAPGWVGALDGALWDPGGILPGWTLSPVVVTGPTTHLSVPSGFGATVVDRAGDWTPPPCLSGRCEANATAFAWNGSELTVTGNTEKTTATPGEFLTSSGSPAAGACNLPGGTLTERANGTVAGPAYLAASASLASAGPNNWATLQLDGGNVSLVLQAYQNATSATLSSIGLNALYRGVSYVWHNTPLPAATPDGGSVRLALTWNATTAFGTWTSGNWTSTTSLSFGDAAADATNPGFAPAAAPPNPVSLTVANASIALSGGVYCLQNATIDQVPDASYLVADGPGAPTDGSSIATNGSVNSGGDVIVRSGTDPFVVLGYPYDGLWTSTLTAGGELTNVPGAPFANVLSVGEASVRTTVTFHFHTAILLGLEGSWFEVGGLLAIVMYLTVRPHRRRGVALPSNTPGASSPAPPLGRER